MKKILLLLSVALMGVSCGWDGADTYWYWNVKNSTSQTVILSITGSKEIYTLLPGDVFFMGNKVTRTSNRKKVHFEDYFEDIANRFGESASWQILSDNRETVLKTWRYSERGQQGQRFFDESNWSFAGTTWTFEIQPSDIASE